MNNPTLDLLNQTQMGENQDTSNQAVNIFGANVLRTDDKAPIDYSVSDAKSQLDSSVANGGNSMQSIESLMDNSFAFIPLREESTPVPSMPATFTGENQEVNPTLELLQGNQNTVPSSTLDLLGLHQEPTSQGNPTLDLLSKQQDVIAQENTFSFLEPEKQVEQPINMVESTMNSMSMDLGLQPQGQVIMNDNQNNNAMVQQSLESLFQGSNSD